MINETTVRVRYQETDKMGVVYHANYLVWFEIGRTEYFRKIGLEYSDLEERGLLAPVVDVRCFYKSPAKYDDEIIIRTRITEIKSVKARFEYEIMRALDSMILATGFTTHAFVSKDLKIVNLKKKYEDIFNRIYESMVSNLV